MATKNRIAVALLCIIATLCALLSLLALSACGKGEEEVSLSADGHTHTYGEWQTVTPAGCESKGLEERVCSGCSEDTEGHKETREIEALGHEWGEGIITTQPTCSSAGEKTYVCTRDSNHKKTEIVSMTPHVYGDWRITAPTATAKGKAVKECVYCAKSAEGHEVVFPLDELTAANAVEGKYVYEETTPATCTAEGVGEYTIDYAELEGVDKTFRVKLPALGHTVTSAAQNFALGEGGTAEVTCSRCSAAIKTISYQKAVEFPYNEGSPLALGENVYYTQSEESVGAYFKFVITAEGEFSIKIENFGPSSLIGDGAFLYVNGEQRETVAAFSGGELTSADQKFTGECTADVISFKYAAQTADLGKELCFSLPTEGTAEAPHGLLVTTQFPEREKPRIYLGVSETATITAPDSYVDSYTVVMTERADYSITFSQTSGFSDLPRPVGFSLMVYLDGELNEEGMLTGSTLIFDYNSFDFSDQNNLWSISNIFRGEPGTHTLTFSSSSVGSVKFTLSKRQQSILSTDRGATTPNLKAQTPGTSDGGSYSVLISGSATAGWYQVYVPINQGNGRNPIAFVIGGREFVKYYLSKYEDVGGNPDQDSYAMRLWLNPGDEVTIKNIGLEDMSFNLSLIKHTDHNLADDDTAEWQITQPTQDGTGLATRLCGLVDEVIVLPALSDGGWTKEGSTYSRTFGGETITFDTAAQA